MTQTYSYLPIVLSGSCAAQFCGRNQQVRRNAPKRRMNFSRNRGFAPLRYAHSPQDICNKVTVWGIKTAKSQKTVSRAKAEPSFTPNRPVQARRRGKEGAVGKKARGRSIQTISGHPRPIKTEKSKDGSVWQLGSR